MRLGRVLTRNVVSNEQNVAGVVSKVALGSAVAGFVYVTDGEIASGRVRTIRLPAWAQPPIRYAFCIVQRSGGEPRGRAGVRQPGPFRARPRAFCAPRASGCRGADRMPEPAEPSAGTRLVLARRAGFTALLALATGVVVVFLALPLVALFTEVPLRRIPSLLGDPAVRDALRVTVRTNLVANAAILLFGTPAAYFLATRRFRGRALVVTLIELPLVLPPAVAGIAMLSAFGATGLVGDRLADAGIVLPFTEWAVVVAVTFVAAPFYLRQGITAFESVDPALPDAARTLGASPARTFARVALPLAASGLLAGWVLAFARGVGEFGATIIFAGNVHGQDPDAHAGDLRAARRDFDVAIAISILLVVLSAGRPALLQAPRRMETLRADIAVGLRAFALSLGARASGARRIALVGPSGAGKTTVLRAIAGLRRPDRGRIALGDEVWFDGAARRVARIPSRRSVGLVFQEYALFPHLTVRRNVAFGGRARADELLERFGIAAPRRAASGRDLRRRAPAGGARTGARARPGRAAARRAAVGARRPDPGRDPRRAAGPVRRARAADAARHPRLPRRGGARRSRRRARRRDACASSTRRSGSRPRPPTRSSRASPVPTSSSARRRRTVRAARGSCSRTARSSRTAQRASGRVVLAVQPWRIALSDTAPADGAANAVPGRVASVTPDGGRLRVRVGALEVDAPGATADVRRGDRLYAVFEPAAALVLPSS